MPKLGKEGNSASIGSPSVGNFPADGSFLGGFSGVLRSDSPRPPGGIESAQNETSRATISRSTRFLLEAFRCLDQKTQRGDPTDRSKGRLEGMAFEKLLPADFQSALARMDRMMLEVATQILRQGLY